MLGDYETDSKMQMPYAQNLEPGFFQNEYDISLNRNSVVGDQLDDTIGSTIVGNSAFGAA